MSGFSIRQALESDLPIINEIYNHYVTHSTCTYQTEPSTIDERRRWFEEHREHEVVTVAEVEGRVVGWACLSQFHPRAAYRLTVENSVYVHPNHLRQGVGLALLADLIERGKRMGFHTIIAVISRDQIPSIKLHEDLGFDRAGLLCQVGNKFDQWLDVVYMQLMLK
jgi:phosphinothricin acetyltransferase